VKFFYYISIGRGRDFSNLIQDDNGPRVVPRRDSKQTTGKRTFEKRFGIITTNKKKNFIVRRIVFKLPKPKSSKPDFSWCMTPKPEKVYQMNTKCTEWL
jgi:hypothetical protein